MNNLSKDQKRIGDKMEFDMEYSLANGKIIGSGSFGSVYKLVSSYDNIEWAVKIIEVPDREEYKGSAEHEINIFQNMDSHQNIIGIKRVYSWINDLTHKFAAVIVQELADTGLYEEFMKRKKANMPYSEEEVLNYLKQSVEGLHFIMTKNSIYHRDIKTENFLLKNNQIKITDFGVSKSIQAEKIRTLSTNTITGTPLFLSPKLWDSYIKRSEFNVVHDLQKSDIFSLGLVYLQLALLLSNPEMAGLNQPEGDKKLSTLLNRIRSNKLRTILASMLAFEEVKRADYNTILKYISMKESDFSNTQMNQYVNQNSQKTPYYGQLCYYFCDVQQNKQADLYFQQIKLKIQIRYFRIQFIWYSQLKILRGIKLISSLNLVQVEFEKEDENLIHFNAVEIAPKKLQKRIFVVLQNRNEWNQIQLIIPVIVSTFQHVSKKMDNKDIKNQIFQQSIFIQIFILFYKYQHNNILTLLQDIFYKQKLIHIYFLLVIFRSQFTDYKNKFYISNLFQASFIIENVTITKQIFNKI